MSERLDSIRAMGRRGRCVFGVLSVALVLVAPAPAARSYEPAVELFTFKDDRIAESSGVAASSTQDTILFTHNDSGDSARFFAVDRFGCTLTTYGLKGADAVDWEDMARGPDDKGRSSLFFGDIGDNLHERSDGISVYRVPEPRVDTSRSAAKCPPPLSATTAWRRFDLRYPGLPEDAESLLVHPRTGQVFIVTKTYLDVSDVYAAPDPLDPAHPNVLERVATIVFPPSDADPTFNPPYGATGRVNATGGEISPRADRVVVRTYTDAWEWPVSDGDVIAAFGGTPSRVVLPSTMQGEAIAYTANGRSLVTTSEGVNAPVHLVRG